MSRTDICGRTVCHKLVLGKLADRLQHRIAGPPSRPLRDKQRLAHQGVSRSRTSNSSTSSAPATARALPRSKPPAKTEHFLAVAFRPRRAGRKTRPPCGAASGVVPDRVVTRPTTGTVDLDDPAPPTPSSTPSAMPPTRWPTESRQADGRSRPRRPLRRIVNSKSRHDARARSTKRSTAAEPIPASTSSEGNSHRCSSAIPALPGWSPEFAPSSTAPGSCRSTRPPRHAGAHSCRRPTAASCPPSPQRCSPPTSARLLGDTEDRGHRIGHRIGIGDGRQFQKPYSVGKLVYSAASQPPPPAVSCRHHRPRSA